MANHSWRIDWSDQTVIATSTADANATIPAVAADGTSFWLMGVSGVPAHINAGAAATTAMPAVAVGQDDEPKEILAGTVMHAITDAGTGLVWFVRAHPVVLPQEG